MGGTTRERFFAKVKKAGDCWIWTGGTSGGRAIFWDGRRRTYARRWIYEQVNNASIPGAHLEPTCGNAMCVNPEHLRRIVAKKKAVPSGRQRHEVPCVSCGKKLSLVERALPHCQTPECRLGYAKVAYERGRRREGAHRIWMGKFRSSGTAIISAADYSLASLKREFRVLDVALLVERDMEIDSGRRFRHLCDVSGCVSIEHNEIIRSQRNAPSASSVIRAKLPAAPVLRLVDAKVARDALDFSAPEAKALGGRVVMTPGVADAVAKARQQGTLTVSAVDQICCDYLELHPYQVYGDAFYDAS